MLVLRRLSALVALSAGVLVLGASGVAFGAGGAPAPGYEVLGTFSPGNLPPGGGGLLRLYVYDIGAEPGNGEGITLVNSLPAGMTVASEYPFPLPSGETGGCSGSPVVTCKIVEPAPGPEPEEVVIPVHIAVGTPEGTGPLDHVSLVGGGSAHTVQATVPVWFGTGLAPAGFANADLWVSNADGTIDTQAGSHPYEFTMAFTIRALDGEFVEKPAGGEPEAIDVNLPPGLVGEPGAVPECPRRLYDGEECPTDTMIGEDMATVGELGPVHAGVVYNLIPPPGIAAQFAFTYNGTHVFLDAKVRSGGDYGITVHANAPQLKLNFNTITVWGTPGDPRHGTGAPAKPFLTLPTSCGAPPVTRAEMLGTWQNPEAVIPPVTIPWHNVEGEPVGLTGCERLVHFNPSLSVGMDTSAADSPAGLTTRIRFPQGENPEALATSGLKETTVQLPEGVVVNPGQATGLVACQDSEDGLPAGEEDGESERFDGPASCPAASKVGSDEFIIPLLKKPLTGGIYVLQSNPPEVKLLFTASGEGVNVKEIGTVQLDKTTGRLTATFDGNPRYPGTPDAPIDEIVASFSGGAQAALITPALCGERYESSAEFTPWSSPFVENAFATSSFQITTGPGGTGSCAAPLPFAPTLTAGSTTDQAGGFTNFSMLLQRPDGQQRIKSLQFKAPEGLSGMISNVPVCPEPQANEGDCPAASQIGHTIAGAGAGPYPFFLPQVGQPPAPIYLTGPYNGQPFGLSIVVPVIAGPFNLGTEVVRASIGVDPKTTQITVTVDSSGPHALPTILDGVPADLRSINAVIDKHDFMFNPTHCGPMAFTGTATGTEGATANLASRFQVGSCQALKFKPKLKISTSAKTSRSNGASLTFKLTYPTGELGANQATSQANIGKLKVELPKRLPSRLTTLRKACLAAVFDANPANCPAASIVGHATAITPVLPVPVSGPAYFVSHGGEAFPSLVMVLQGDNVTVDLESTTFISKKGVTSGTLKQIPDTPVKSFELKLPTGPHSALAALGNLCKHKMTVPTEFTGQNNAYITEKIPVTVNGCKKTRRHNSHARQRRKG